MQIKNLKLQRIVMEVFGGCNYTCQMCPQSNPGRGKSFTRKMPLIEFERILDNIVPKYGKKLNQLNISLFLYYNILITQNLIRCNSI